MIIHAVDSIIGFVGEQARWALKAVILAGGRGTRIEEDTQLLPKPMIEIGGRPILWHIMKIYSTHRVKEFIICCGYRGYVIKEYFANYFLHMSDVTFDMSDNTVHIHSNNAEPWIVTLVDTGDDSMTGGRLKRVAKYLAAEDDFCLTYGDGVANVDITGLLEFHRGHGKLATLTATRPPGRYGAINFGDRNAVASFEEKPLGDRSWINGGFFVLHPSVIDYVDGDATSWEGAPLAQLAMQGELEAFKHEGFWQPMDTLRDKNHLNQLWNSGSAPWKTW